MLVTMKKDLGGNWPPVGGQVEVDDWRVPLMVAAGTAVPASGDAGDSADSPPDLPLAA